AASILAERGFDHLPIVDDEGRLVGIVTSWDIAIAVGKGRRRLSEVMTSKVITAREDEPIDAVARRLETHNISGVPVVDTKERLKGILTTDDISKLFGRRGR
ncbi:MAG: CBS domain-containing protein, partial [Candidatus Hadarchaeales archaeon]